jgi:CRISPR/Cas system-associated exonuclease Cas4 (RecB family)
MAWSNTWKKKLYMPGQKEVFALSRSKIDLFIQCPKCFYLDRVHGVSRPSIPAFLLNSAVDELFKKEFDIHRAAKRAHPIMEQYGIDALPFQHPDLEEWRHNFTGVRTVHQPTNFELFGAVDDIWINAKGELHVVDYKSTSKDEAITLEDKWKAGYKRQVEIYQWLLRQKGFAVSDTGYFVYANASKDREAFDGKLEFDVTVLEYVGDTGWIEDVIFNIKKVLDSEVMPAPHMDCEYCEYVMRRNRYEPAEGDTITIEM